MKKNWKFYLGIVLFTYSWIPYIFVFLIEPFLSFSTTVALSLSSALLISAEVAFAISVVLLGKEFIKLIKTKLRTKFFREKGDPGYKPISRLRYRIGIIIFLISMAVPTLLMEVLLYFDFVHLIGDTNSLYILLAFDVLFISSIFILGGEFLDKLRGLFTYSKVIDNQTMNN
ncbi:MAG: transporter suffix domain-containing protein [Bacteroidales bacterium]|nr:transporter suffix domain-containing protein [Bacteroidales bacterium]